MEPLFRIASTLKQKAVLWFVNRSMEPQIYALDELFMNEAGQRVADAERGLGGTVGGRNGAPPRWASTASVK